MSRNKRANGADDLYRTHLGNYGYRANTAVIREQTIERMYFRILFELCANRFKWSGLPDEVDVRWLETILFRQAAAVFFKDDDYDKYFALQLGAIGNLNMMNNPTTLRAIGNGYTKGLYNATAIRNHLSSTIPGGSVPGVPIWANYARMPDLDIVTIYAGRLANFDRTIEVNSMNARQTKVIAAEENTRLSMENINRQMEEGQQAVRVKGGIGVMDNIIALDLGVNPDTIEKLDIVRARQWNVCMGLLGIDNANQDKKERLVESEVGANDEQTDSMKFVNLNARRMAANSINEVFGLDVTVDYNTEVEAKSKQMFNAIISEIGNDSESEEIA